MPNQPRTPQRSFRAPDRLWFTTQAIARIRGDNVPDLIRGVLERYNRRYFHLLPPEEVQRINDRYNDEY